MSARAALSSRSSPLLLVALLLPSLSFPAFAQVSNKRLPPTPPWRMTARVVLSSRPSPLILEAFLLSSLSFSGFAQLSNKRLSLSLQHISTIVLVHSVRIPINNIYYHCAPAHAPGSARSPFARPLPCVDRTIGERNLITPRGLLAQLTDLSTYCSDCAPAHAPCSSIYTLNLSHHVLLPHGA